MFGLESFSIILVYLLCIASAILCVVYGIFNLKKGDMDADEYAQTMKWNEEEEDIEENI